MVDKTKQKRLKENDSANEAIRNEERKKFFDRKKQVYDMETYNDNKLIFFRQNKDWWRLGGTSAVLYAYCICKRLGYTANLREDKDKDYKFSEGICSMKNERMLLLEQQLLVHDIKLIKKTDDDIWIFELPEKYSKRVVVDIARAEYIRREQLCNELAVKQVMVETQKCLKRIERIWDNVTLFKNKNNGYVTRTLFKNSANKLVEMQTILNVIARRPVTLKSNVIKLNSALEEFKDYVSEIIVLSRIDIPKIDDLVDKIRDFENAVEQDRERIERQLFNEARRK